MTLKRTLPESPYWSPPFPVWTMDPWHVPDRPARSVSDWVRGGRTERTLCCERRTGAVRKNNSVSGRPAGWLKKGRLETFFFIFTFLHFLIFLKKKRTIFSCKKKKVGKKKNCGCPTGFNFSHPLDRKQIFFMDGLGGSLWGIYHRSL